MTTLREAAQMALDALDSDNPDIQLRAATQLRAALAQPEQEPVAWMHDSHVGFNVPLYTAPPQREWCQCKDAPNDCTYEKNCRVPQIDAAFKRIEWQGLTDEEYEAMAEKYVTNCYFDTLKYARAIEARLREKNQ